MPVISRSLVRATPAAGRSFFNFFCFWERDSCRQGIKSYFLRHLLIIIFLFHEGFKFNETWLDLKHDSTLSVFGGALPQKRTVLHMMCQFWDSAEWSDRVTLNWEFSLNSSSVELSIRPIHMKNSKMGLFSKKRELICIIEDWHYWEPIRSPFRHDHVIIDCQSKATLVYNRQFRVWRIFLSFADGSDIQIMIF